MRSRCLIGFKSQAARGDDLASAVAGYWRIRDTMPNTFGAIATATYWMQPAIPLPTMNRKPKPGLPRLFDQPKLRQRNFIERMFGWVKENRRIGTRYDKLAKSFAAMVSLACTMRCLRHYFSYAA